MVVLIVLCLGVLMFFFAVSTLYLMCGVIFSIVKFGILNDHLFGK